MYDIVPVGDAALHQQAIKRQTYKGSLRFEMRTQRVEVALPIRLRALDFLELL